MSQSPLASNVQNLKLNVRYRGSAVPPSTETGSGRLWLARRRPDKEWKRMRRSLCVTEPFLRAEASVRFLKNRGPWSAISASPSLVVRASSLRRLLRQVPHHLLVTWRQVLVRQNKSQVNEHPLNVSFFSVCLEDYLASTSIWPNTHYDISSRISSLSIEGDKSNVRRERDKTNSLPCFLHALSKL